MKAPDWVIEMMKTGEPVKCMVWDDEPDFKQEGTVSAFSVSDSAELKYFVDDDHAGEWFEHAEPIKPPTVRPFRTGEEVEPFFGKVVKIFCATSMIIGATYEYNHLLVICGKTACEPDELFRSATFSDGSPVGITE